MPLSWFRRPKANREHQAPAAAAVPTVEPEPPYIPAAPADAPVPDGQSTAAKKRRRGSRGGRGRKRPADGAVAAATEESTPTAETLPAAAEKAGPPKKPAERKAREPRVRTPRRTAPRRAPLPKAKRELLVSVDPGEKRVAVLEDDVVAEVYLERPEQRSIAGNIYLGTVDNVLPGMEAAFVEIGLEKNGFLYVDEIVGPELEGRRGARKIQDLIQRGQTILVQAVKDPMKTKGARLTTEISLPGRFVVYVPQGDGLGVSRRLEDDERNRLKAIVKGIAPETGGVIVRTAAEGASAEDVERDLEFLRRLWETIETAAKKAKAPALIYQEAELPLRVTRDLFTGDFERLIVDHDRTYKRIVGYLKKTSPHMVDRVTRHKEREPLLEAFGVEQEIRSTLNRRVDLPSGGYLIFDYAEAFTVVDVNTGRFVGSRSKRDGAGRLEDTITKNNLEAVKEVVRQLRLRDVGGIIVIDFIDMANPKNRQQVEDALRLELERDRTKTYVVEISPLGLVEMTRQNVTDGPREVMTRRCPTCDGDGIVVSEGTTAVEIERRLRGLVTPGSRAKAFKVELNAKVAALLVGPDASRLHELEEVTKRRFFFVPVEDVHLDHFRVLGQGVGREPGAGCPGCGRGRDRGEARRGRAARPACGRRQGEGVRGHRRRRRPTGRQEGQGAGRGGDGGGRLRRPRPGRRRARTARSPPRRRPSGRRARGVRPGRRRSRRSRARMPQSTTSGPTRMATARRRLPRLRRKTRRSPLRPGPRGGARPPSAGRRRRRLPPTRTRPRATRPARTSPKEPRQKAPRASRRRRRSERAAAPVADGTASASRRRPPRRARAPRAPRSRRSPPPPTVSPSPRWAPTGIRKRPGP